MIVFNAPIKVLLKYKVISDDANRWFRADFDGTAKGFEDAVMAIKREDQRGTKDLKLVAKYTDGSIKILAQSKEELDEKVSASTIEKLVKMADRFDQKGKHELADRIDAVVKSAMYEDEPTEIKCPYCKGKGYRGALGDTCDKCEGSGVYEVYPDNDEQQDAKDTGGDYIATDKDTPEYKKLVVCYKWLRQAQMALVQVPQAEDAEIEQKVNDASILVQQARRIIRRRLEEEGYKEQDARDNECPDCEHKWSQHKRTANGAYTCNYHGCGCRDVVKPNDQDAKDSGTYARLKGGVVARSADSVKPGMDVKMGGAWRKVVDVKEDDGLIKIIVEDGHDYYKPSTELFTRKHIEQDAEDPNETEELIEKLEKEPFEPKLDEEPTDKEMTDLWEEEI